MRGKAGLLIAALSMLSAIFLHTGALHAAPPLEVYGRLPGFEMAAMSPSGDHVAVIGMVAEKRQLIISDLNGNLINGYGLGDLKIRGLYWAGDQRVLVRTSNTAVLGVDFTANKTELEAMVVVPADGGTPWTVFANNGFIAGGIRGFYGVRLRGGRWYGYFGGITLDVERAEKNLNSTNPVLYEVDLQTRKSRKIAQRTDSNENYRTWLVDANGGVGATLDFHPSDGQWRIRNPSGAQIAGGKDVLGTITLVGFGATADSIIYSSSEQNSGDNHWYLQPLSGGTATEILQDEAFDATYFDNRSGRLLGYALRGDRPSYRFLDAHQNKVVAATLKAFPDLSVDLIGWNDSFDRLVVKTEGDNDPMTWWTVDIRTGDAKMLGTSYAIASSDVAPSQMIRYKAADGLDIAAVLTLPPGKVAKSLPVVVFPHGGPAARDYPGFDWWAQAFASHGYAVLQPNFRGSTGYGTSFEKAGHGEWGRKMQTDISDGLAKLVKDGIVDAKRACIMGASYGGYAALAGVTLQKGLYRCAVSVAGIGDVRKMTLTDLRESGDNKALRRNLQNEVGSGRDLDAVSPIRFAAAADAPILLIHGKDDTVVDYAQSSAMAAALTRAGKSVDFVTLPGEDHWLSKSETRLTMLKAALAFVEKYNPPTP